MEPAAPGAEGMQAWRGSDAAPASAIPERLGIAGSGTIACGLAATAAEHGPVYMYARSHASAARARDSVRKVCERAGEAARSERIAIDIDPDPLRAATVLVEAVIEDEDTKKRVNSRLSELAGADTLIATTTSSLSVGRLAAQTKVADRFFGLHVFNPVPRMDLVELVFPDQAAVATRARAFALCSGLGKTAVEVPDIPGFVVNNLLFRYLFNAVELLEQTEMAPDQIDACMTGGAGHPMGPCALLDYVGLDVAVAIGDSLGVTVPQRLRNLVAEGALGKKSGRGLFAAR